MTTFTRRPEHPVPAAIEKAWSSIQMKDSDERLKEDRFQTGHMIAIYWETVARWIVMRAKRDAASLCTPLFLLQAADVSKPIMSVDMAKKLMNKANPGETSRMHGMLTLHLGMHVRLLDPPLVCASL